MRLFVLLMALGVSGMAAPDSVSANRPDQAGTPTGESGTGRTLYVDHCASCHGPEGRGDGPMTDSLRTRPADLTRYARANGGVFPNERLRQVIDGRGVRAHGSVQMPVWGSVFKTTAGGDAAARTRIDAIVDYLRRLQEQTGD